MVTERYVPPVQGKLGMVLDSLFLLALVYAALLLPLLGSTSYGEEATPARAEAASIDALPATSWESLDQNPVMQEQWRKLGLSLEQADAIIEDKFDYTIRPLSLGAIAVIIVGYFFFLLRISDREYREVIRERFGDRTTP